MYEKMPEKVDLRGAVENYFYHYAEFRGRSSRSEYGYIWLFSVCISLLAFVVVSFFADIATALDILTVLIGLYALATIVPSLALIVRRLRDAGYSPFWIFIGLVPFVGGIWLLILCLYDSAYPEGFRLYDNGGTSEPSTMSDITDEIQQLQDLHDRGLIDDEQLKAAKNKALGI